MELWNGAFKIQNLQDLKIIKQLNLVINMMMEYWQKMVRITVGHIELHIYLIHKKELLYLKCLLRLLNVVLLWL